MHSHIFVFYIVFPVNPLYSLSIPPSTQEIQFYDCSHLVLVFYFSIFFSLEVSDFQLPKLQAPGHLFQILQFELDSTIARTQCISNSHLMLQFNK